MSTDEQPKSLGERVRWARLRRGMTQAALGTAAKVSQGTIGNIESGIRERPRELLAIARALKAAPEWLETGKGEWDASRATIEPGSLFDALTDDEQRLLDNFRAMLDDDQRHFAEEIATRAAKMRAYTTKVLEKVGAASKPAKHSADAKRTAVARAALEVTDRLRQEQLFDESRRGKS